MIDRKIENYKTHLLPMFSDLLIALKEGHYSNGNHTKDCEN